MLTDFIPSNLHEITVASLDSWEERDRQGPFLPDNRRGYAHVKPVGWTSTGCPSSTLLPVDQYPLHGLGFYDVDESSEQFSSYIWSGWTSKAVQQMQVEIRMLLLC